MKIDGDRDGLSGTLTEYFPKKVNTEVLPCPACGKEDLVWFGIESSCCSGVGCRRCHLQVTQSWAAVAPRRARDVPPAHYHNFLYIHYAFKALVTWNKILRSKPCTTRPKKSKASRSPTTAPSATPTSASTPPATPPSSSSSERPASRGRKRP